METNKCDCESCDGTHERPCGHCGGCARASGLTLSNAEAVEGCQNPRMCDDCED